MEKAKALLKEAGLSGPLAVRLGLSTGNADTLYQGPEPNPLQLEMVFWYDPGR